jgi:hypothetical protein
MDFYSKLNPFSVALQNQELLISSLKVKIEHAICTLNELKSNVGVHEKEFLNLVSLSGKYKEVQLIGVESGEQHFKMLRGKIIDRAVSYTRERLESVSSEVIECLHIFDSRGWPSRELLMEYGTPEIKTVFCHFSPDPEKIDNLLAEWVEYEFLFSKLTLKEALRRTVTDKDCQHISFMRIHPAVFSKYVR